MAQAAEIEIPAVMRAVVCTGYGQPGDVLSLQDAVDVPQPEENQVLIRVHAASLNPLDYKLTGGYVREMMPITFPKIIGYDVAGTIVKLGENVSSFSVGDAVMGQAFPMGTGGTFAEYVVCGVTSIVGKPNELSFVEAAGAPCVTNTSYQALTMKSQIVAGESNVLILGGSSSTGMAGLQIARALNAAFIATTSSKPELCKELGAHEVVNYRENDVWEVFASSERKFDIIYDCVGGAVELEKVQAVTKPGSVFVTIAGQPPQGAEYPAFAFHVQDLSATNGPTSELLAAGSVKVILDDSSPFALEDFQEMYQRLIEGRVKGKLVMKMI